MRKGPMPADRPLVCQRQFEPSRVQQQLWSEAYEQVVPSCRVPAGAGAAARRQPKAANGSPVVSSFPEERCA
jgi:hypothetical protein